MRVGITGFAAKEAAEVQQREGDFSISLCSKSPIWNAVRFVSEVARFSLLFGAKGLSAPLPFSAIQEALGLRPEAFDRLGSQTLGVSYHRLPLHHSLGHRYIEGDMSH